MTVDELTVMSSVQIFKADIDNVRPQGFGTGFIAKYLGYTLLVTVSHVTNDDDLTTFLETNLPPDGTTTPLSPIGGLIYFDVLKITDGMNLNDFENLIQNDGERIDITFAKFDEQVELRQPEADFGSFKINEGEKLWLDLDYASVPNKGDFYSFYGKIKPEYKGIYLQMTPTLNTGLRYRSTVGNFHIFLAPEIIKDKNDYSGCSGAPILDSEGRIVALACKVHVGTKRVFGFSIQECMKLIKIAVDTKQL